MAGTRRLAVALALLFVVAGALAPPVVAAGVDAPDRAGGSVAARALANNSTNATADVVRTGARQVTVSVSADAFSSSAANATVIVQFGQNELRKKNGQVSGDRYNFTLKLLKLVSGERVTAHRPRVSVSVPRGPSFTDRVDVRYLSRSGTPTVVGGRYRYPVVAYGFKNGTDVSTTVSGDGSATVNATLAYAARNANVYLDPSSFADRVSPLGNRTVRFFPDADYYSAKWQGDFRSVDGASARFLVADGPVATHPLLFADETYLVVAATNNPTARYVRRHNASRSGAVAVVPLSKAAVNAGSVTLTVRHDGSRVFRTKVPGDAFADSPVTATYDADNGSFAFDASLPGTVESVWLAHDGTIRRPSSFNATGARLSVPVDDNGSYRLLVVGANEVVRAQATVNETAVAGGSGGGSRGADLLVPLLVGGAALVGGIGLTLVMRVVGERVGELAYAFVWLPLVVGICLLLGIALLYLIPETVGSVGYVALGLVGTGLVVGFLPVDGRYAGSLLALVLGAVGLAVATVAPGGTGNAPVLVGGYLGSLGVFGVTPLLGGGGGTTATSHDITVQLVDRTTGQPLDATVEVTARKKSTPSNVVERFTVREGRATTRLTDGQWEFDPGAAADAVTETVRNSRTVKLPLPPDRLHLTVESAGGESLSGASVDVETDDRSLSLTTDGRGVVEDELPAGTDEATLTVTADDYETYTGRTDTKGGVSGTVTLQPQTGSLEAIVSLDGVPVGNLPVLAHPRSGPGSEPARGRTDERGRVTLDDVPVGEYELSVELPADADEFAFDSREVTVREGATETGRIDVNFDYELPAGVRDRQRSLRDRLDSLASHPRSDMAIPSYYASVVDALLDAVERVPEQGEVFLRAGRTPGETADAMLSAAKAGTDAVDAAISTKQNVDLFAACADMDPVDTTWNGSFDLSELFDLADTDTGSRRAEVAERLDAVDERIGSEVRDLSEIRPARDMWEETRSLVTVTDRADLEAAAVVLLADALLDAIESMFDRDPLRERMQRTVF